MTSICISSNTPEETGIMIYSIEAINYDGESEFDEIEASSREEALKIAAKNFPNADYIMIQGCYQPW